MSLHVHTQVTKNAFNLCCFYGRTPGGKGYMYYLGATLYISHEIVIIDAACDTCINHKKVVRCCPVDVCGCGAEKHAICRGHQLP